MCAVSDDLNTPEQHAYVDSIPDDGLRSALLHQVRLRDNAESNAKFFEAEVNNGIRHAQDLQKALDRKEAQIATLCNDLHSLRQKTQVMQGRLDLLEMAHGRI